MTTLRVVNLPKDNEDQTVTPDVGQDITSCLTNDFWQQASATSDKDVKPRNREDLA